MDKHNVRKELKALGSELSVALKQIRSSREFKHLESEVTAGIKNIATSLAESLKAANKSPQAKKIKTRLKRVAEAGAAQGKVEAARAQKAAVKGLRKVRAAVRQMRNRTKQG